MGGLWSISALSAWCLPLEWYILTAAGFPQDVIVNIQIAPVSSTRFLYNNKLKVIEEWCHMDGHTSFQCLIGVILSFFCQFTLNLANLLNLFSLADITACHVGLRSIL